MLKNNPNLMLPLWLKYPFATQYSIGWRMGAGESYKYQFNDWFNDLSDTERQEYQQLFPAPTLWQGYYDDPEHDESEENFFCHNDYPVQLWGKKNGEPTFGWPELKQSVQQKNKHKFIFFWGHQPAKDGSVTKSCFSQWWYSQFSVDIDDYCCMEQYMMAEKARLFADEATEKLIMQSRDPKEIKALGRMIKNFEQEPWDRAKFSIIASGNYYKFLQHPDLCEFLLNTGDRVLVEASPYDKVWGIGMRETDGNAHNPLLWQGENLLGFALMAVRDELRRVLANQYLAK